MPYSPTNPFGDTLTDSDFALLKWVRRADETLVWSEGRAERPCPSMSDAEAARSKAVKFLDRHAWHSTHGQNLRRRLIACTNIIPCRSGACPLCVRASQRLFTKNVDRFLKKEGGEFASVTVVSAPTVSWGQEGSDQLNPVHWRLNSVFGSAGVKWAIGGIDFSYNEREGYLPMLQPHAHFIVPQESLRALMAPLRQSFPKDPEVIPRPILVRSFDGALNGIAYCFKRDFHRRQVVPAGVRPDGTLRRRNTRERPLTADQRLELMFMLDRHRLETRILTYRIRWHLKHRGWRLIRAR